MMILIGRCFVWIHQRDACLLLRYNDMSSFFGDARRCNTIALHLIPAVNLICGHRNWPAFVSSPQVWLRFSKSCSLASKKIEWYTQWPTVPGMIFGFSILILFVLGFFWKHLQAKSHARKWWWPKQRDQTSLAHGRCDKLCFERHVFSKFYNPSVWKPMKATRMFEFWPNKLGWLTVIHRRKPFWKKNMWKKSWPR